jgi:hypothetical protein
MPCFLRKAHELVGCACVNVIAVITCTVVDLLRAEFPHNLNLIAPGFGDGIRVRNHAAKIRPPNFRHVVLNHEGVPDGFNIDRHRMTDIGCGGSRCDVCVRAAPILRIWKAEEPIRDIDLLEGRMDYGSSWWRVRECDHSTYVFLLAPDVRNK